jgi:hypothetical protein
MTTSHRIERFWLVPLLLFQVGCGPDQPVPVDPEPSYAELVMILNAELETLDRLERKRADLVAQHEQRQRPNRDEAMKALAGAFESAWGAIPENSLGETGDPQAALDRAVEGAEKAQEVFSQLFQAGNPQAGTAGEPANDAAAASTPDTEEFQQQLALLDQEIEQQRARVERARQDRDAVKR